MLEGINVLNTYEIVNPEWHDMIFPAVAFAFLAVVGIVLIVCILCNREYIQENFGPLVFVIVGTLFFMVGSIYGFTHLPENKYQTRYAVTLDDHVNFNEFTAKYEVVKQEGLIYTIVEKTNEG